MNYYQFPQPANIQVPNFSSAAIPQNLNLRQIQGYKAPSQFTDSDGHVWKLAKSSNDSGIEIPDPEYMQVLDYWSHAIPGADNQVFIYAVEGIKQPKIATETPVLIMYTWFSTVNNPSFTPQMIMRNEWLIANVYTSPITNTRLSKFKALCSMFAEEKQEPSKPIENINLNEVRANARNRKTTE